MLIILIEEFNTTPIAYLDNRVYNRIRKEFLNLLRNEKAVDAILFKYWNHTLRELSCNSMVNVMNCFVLLQGGAIRPGASAFCTKRGSKILTSLCILPIDKSKFFCYNYIVRLREKRKPTAKAEKNLKNLQKRA